MARLKFIPKELQRTKQFLKTSILTSSNLYYLKEGEKGKETRAISLHYSHILSVLCLIFFKVRFQVIYA